jgi:purine-binding chemotaxis protein CheW
MNKSQVITVGERHKAGGIDGSLAEVTLLTFHLAEQKYGIAVESVVQIIEMVTITYLPHAPATVQGVINFHGRIVPVLDLRCRFNLPFRPYELYTPIILVHMDEQVVGLVVDSVDEVDLIPTADLVKPDHFHLADLLDLLDDDTDLPEAERPPLPSAFLSAIATVANMIILVLNVEAILTHQEQKSLLRALATVDAH